MPRLLDGRIALVTGASRGIGRAVALDLARAGAHVIALARTQGALEELDDEIRREGGQATLVPCDLKDFGVLGPLTPLAHVAPQQWEETFAVNVTANWRLIRSLDTLLRAAEAGRAVFITSGAGHAAHLKPYWGLYAVSKAALDALARTYAAETANVSRVKVMLADPGPLRTRMRAKAMPGEDPMTLKTPEDFAPKLLPLCTPDWTQTGKLYDFQKDRVLTFMPPA